MYRISKRMKVTESKCSKVVKKIMKLLSLTIYVRIILEAYLFLFLSSVAEVYNANFSSSAKILSYLIAIVLLVSWCGIIYLVIHFWKLSGYSNFDQEKSKFSELFEGLKKTKWARLYYVVFVLRRALSTTWIVISYRAITEARVTIFNLIQFGCLGYICIIRPFEVSYLFLHNFTQ